MTKISNPARDRLEAGELAIGIGLRQARTVDIGKIMAACGYDWLFIDMEHNTMSIDTAAQISVAAQDAGITPIVRVPGYQHFHATRMLDGGALGVVVPHVDTVEVAAEMASNCRYPPIGHRSVTSSLPQIGFERLPVGETTKIVNQSTLLVVMLESPEAIENAEGIAAVEGIDCLLIGTNDLCMEMGIAGQVGDDRVVQAYERVIAACEANGKWAGMGGVYDPPLMTRYVDMGVRMLLAGNDLPLMMAAASERAQAMRALQK